MCGVPAERLLCRLDQTADSAHHEIRAICRYADRLSLDGKQRRLGSIHTSRSTRSGPNGLSRCPFSAEESALLAQVSAERGFVPLQIPGLVAELPVRDLIYNQDRPSFWRSFPADVSPTTDDRPYFFYTLRLTNLADWRYEQGVSNMNNQGVCILYSLLLIVTVLAILTILLPLWWKRRDALVAVPGRWRYLGYFSGLGLAFLLVEIPLIQRFALFLGHPIYALAVTLFAVLLFSGLGSLLSGRLAVHVLPVLLLVLLLYAFGLSPLLRALLFLTLPLRIVLAVLLIASLGLLMGMPMPLGIAALGAVPPS